MSRSSSPAVFPPSLVCVVDTSVLIAFKSLVKIDEQWDLLIRMTAFVEDGRLAFPRQVAKELAYGRFRMHRAPGLAVLRPGFGTRSRQRRLRFRCLPSRRS